MSNRREAYTGHMTYELWHVETANLIDFFDEEGEALLTALAYLMPDEPEVATDVLIIVRDEKDLPTRSIEGDELLHLAQQHVGRQIRQSA